MPQNSNDKPYEFYGYPLGKDDGKSSLSVPVTKEEINSWLLELRKQRIRKKYASMLWAHE